MILLRSIFSVVMFFLCISPLFAQSAEYKETSCPFDTSTLQVDVRCGLMTVPENRQMVNSRQIVLTVMIAESPNPDKSSDPIVYLTGGPGESAIAAMMPILSSEHASQLVRDRDWIIVDQRGTGFSVPRLDCNIFGIARIASPTALIEASDVCHQRYASSGIDLAGYTTDENAADFAALRKAMNYQEWNLFGVSYGTTLALTVMETDPQGIRSVVLDSTLPPQYSFFVSDVNAKIQILERLFEACTQDKACEEAFPELAQRFEEAVQALNKEPIQFNGLQLSGDFLVFALTNTSVFKHDVIEQLPSILDQALKGDFEALAQLLGGVASGADAEEGYETDLVAANDGMGLAVNCNRDARFPGLRDQIKAAADQGAAAIALSNLYLRYLDACAFWIEDSSSFRIPAPVESDIPTLFFVGEWDPSTPLELAQETATSLTNSTIIVFPGEGHSILLDTDNNCPSTLLNDFVNRPQDPLDLHCVEEQYKPISFKK